MPDESALAEASCLGAIMLNPDVLDAIRQEGVQPEDFLGAAHRHIYRAMLRIVEAGGVPDLLVLMDHLVRHHLLAAIGGENYLSRLLDSVPAVSNCAHYAAIVKESSRKRQLAAVGSRLSAAGESELTSREIVSGAMVALEGLTSASDERLQGRAVIEVARQIDWTADYTALAIPTGLHALDTALGGGCYRHELMCVGAWPGHGKSALLSHVALNAALKQNVAAYFISLEMSARDVLQRMISTVSGVGIQPIRRGTDDPRLRDRLIEAQARVLDAKLYIREGVLAADAMAGEIRRAVQNWGVQFVALDYIQLVSEPAKERRLQLEDAIQRLLGIAVENDVTILCASQLRKRQQGESQRPTMHDLRESGALFEAPHVVLLLQRPNLGQSQPCEMCGGGGNYHCVCGGTGTTTKDTVADIYIEKNRSGPTGVARAAWHGPCLKFTDLGKEESA